MKRLLLIAVGLFSTFSQPVGAGHETQPLNLAHALGEFGLHKVHVIYAMTISDIRPIGNPVPAPGKAAADASHIMEFKIEEILFGSLSDGTKKGDIKKLSVERREFTGLRPGPWERHKKGDALVVIADPFHTTFQASVENPVLVPTFAAEHLQAEVRDVKFVVGAVRKPLAEQLTLEPLWAHADKYGIEELGWFLSQYICYLYTRPHATGKETFSLYEIVAKISREGFREQSAFQIYDVAKTRSYSPRVSDDSLGALSLAALKHFRFEGEKGEGSPASLTREQQTILRAVANHVLNLTRAEREPSNWQRLKRIRQRPEIRVEIDYLVAYRERLAKPENAEDRKFHQRIDEIIDRFSAN